MTKIYLLITGLLLAGCVSTKLVGTGRNGDKPTVILQYKDHGPGGLRDKNRKEAIKKAKDHCGGGLVKILSENKSTEFKGMDGNYPVNIDFVTLTFECLEGQVKEEIY